MCSHGLALLDAYIRGDSATVLHSIDDSSVLYGSDVAEVFHGPSGVGDMMEEDARLWAGTATIGPMRYVSVQQHGDAATIFFNAPFSVAQRPAVPVRFALVWRQTGKGDWILLQGSNAVITVDQSAAQILKANMK